MRTPRPDLPPKVRVPFTPDWTPGDVDALPALPQLSTSVSAADSHRQCARLHWFKHGRGIETPSSPAQAEGQAIHKDYETGALAHPSVALAVQDGILPRPGPGVEHEREFWRWHDEAQVWVHGFMDVVVGADGTRRLLDLKSRGSAHAATRYAMPAHLLHHDLQLGVYVYVLFAEDDPPQEKIPAGHVYLSRDETTPAALLVEIPQGGLDRVTSGLRWEKIGGIHTAAAEMVPLKITQVQPTRSACGKYGGCAFRGICDAADAAALLGGFPMLNPPAQSPTNGAPAAPSIDAMLAARAPAPPAPPNDNAREIGLWSTARNEIVTCLLEKMGKGYVVRVKGEPEIAGAGTTPEQASLACLGAIPARGAPVAAPAPAAAADPSPGVDMTPPPGEKPYSGKGRHPAWLKARIAAQDGLRADDRTEAAATAAPVTAAAPPEAVPNVPVPLTAAAVASPASGVPPADALRNALSTLRSAENARRAAEAAEAAAAAAAEKARAAFEAWLQG